MHNYEIIFSLLVFQEGTSKFATLELNPKRAQRRHQQQRDLVSRHNQTFLFVPFFISLLWLYTVTGQQQMCANTPIVWLIVVLQFVYSFASSSDEICLFPNRE